MSETSSSTSLVPSGEPTGIDALRQAINFVAKGKPMSSQMVKGLSRMLADHQERVDLVQTVMTHFQMGRLLKVLEGMELVENRAFNPVMVSNYSGRELIELLRLCQTEVRAISGYIDDKASQPFKSSEEGVKDVADPSKQQQKQEASKAVGSLPPRSRQKIIDLIGKLSSNSAIVDIEVVETKV